MGHMATSQMQFEYFVNQNFLKNEKIFKLREKEKAYEYFNNLFKSKLEDNNE